MLERDAMSYFLSLDRHATPAPAPREGRPDGLIAPQGGERVLWEGCASVAEQGTDGDAPMRWSLPPATRILVTDRRIAYAHPVRPTPAAPRDPDALVWPPLPALSPTGVPAEPDAVARGEVRWLWPHELRVRPGVSRAPGRDARPTQVLLVCETAGGERPALVLSGGDLTAVSDADRLANLLRRTIAQFRLDHARTLDLSVAHARMLSRLLIGPEFAGHLGGPGRTLTLAAGLWMARPGRTAPAAELAARLAGTGITEGLQLSARTADGFVGAGA
jgi:hypothetical protein